MRREDVRSLIGRGLRRLLLPFGVFDLSVVYRKDLSEPLEPFRARIPVEIGLAAESEIDGMVRSSPYHDPETLRARLRAGNKCFVARIDGNIVGFNWLAFGAVRDEYYAIRLEARDAYCMDARTEEAYRGHAIHTELLYRMLAHARDMGFRHAYTRVSAMNISSWKTHLRLGWQEIGTTFLFRPMLPYDVGLFGPTVYPVTPARRAGTVADGARAFSGKV